MTKKLMDRSGKRHEFADPTLIVTTATLVVSLVIAAIVVSVGIARADTLAPIVQGNGGRVVLAVLLGLLIAGMGCLTAAVVRDGTHPPRRD